jgi:hypothetical protein
LLVLHTFRFIGLSFLVPGVVSPDLPIAFARDAAYGDIVAAILALATLTTLRSSTGIALAWAFNVWGSFDLLNVFYQANAAGLSPGQLGAAYFIPTAIVPLLLITHGLMFRVLLAEPARASDGDVESVAAPATRRCCSPPMRRSNRDFLLHCRCPPLAQSGHQGRADPCPLLGVKRTCAI